jgi:Protein of unknown function (DUF4446)
MASSLTNAQGIVAIAAAAVAVAAVLACLWLAIAVRRLRAAQRVVLGEYANRDLIAHAADLHDAFIAVREYVGEVAERLDERLAAAELALQGTIAHRALVRYDAYNELSGRQSMSIALLDDTQSGIVLSCIHHRDQARVYAKQVHGGRGELELSPEEAEAVRVALSTPAVAAGAASDSPPAAAAGDSAVRTSPGDPTG